HGGGQHTSEILFRADAGSVARRRCGQSSPIIVSPGRQAEGSQSRPFSIQIVPASTMRYHAYLQWVRMASRNFSRTAVKLHSITLIDGKSNLLSNNHSRSIMESRSNPPTLPGG